MNRLLTMVMLTAWCAVAAAAESPYALSPSKGALDQLLQPKAPAPVQSLTVTADELARLQHTPVGGKLRLPSLDTGLAKSASIELRRVELYAPGARIVGAQGTRKAASERLFFIGTDHISGVGLVYDPRDGLLHGRLIQGAESYNLRSAVGSKGGLSLSVIKSPAEAAGAVRQCELDGETTAISRQLNPTPSHGFSSLSATAKGPATPIFQADIAVDVDSVFIADKFSGSEANAIDWIEDMFLAMNVLYERDLDMNVRISTQILRTNGNDPYTTADLDELADEWFNNQSGVERDFVMLLTGRSSDGMSIGASSFSGIAWVNVYCRNSPSFGSFGSFSVNRIGAASFVDPEVIADGVGHELGHNLGSFHTHCERLASSGTDFVDHCYNESTFQGNMQVPDPDCYQAATACPAGDGTIMSYCHAPASGFDGPGIENGPPSNCSLSSAFHPLIIGKLSSLIADNNPSCIADFSAGGGGEDDLIFRSGLEANESP